MLIQGDSALIPLLDKSIHCVTTSPPYWGLRKYQGEQGRIWGGDSDCVHEWGEKKKSKKRTWDQAVGSSTLEGGKTTQFIASQAVDHGQFCQFCNAWYGGLGLEPTPQQHIENIVQIFAEVHRVLRDDGVVWLNYGDCYAGSGGENANTGLQGGNTIKASSEDGTRSGLWRRNPRKEKLPAGNLMLMPHRIAIALQDWGWIVRNDVVWWKRNPMPESQAGWRFEKEQLRKGSWRHTRAHEYVFMLSKKMQYWSNQEAVREAHKPESIERASRPWSGEVTWNHKKGGLKDGRETMNTCHPSGRNPRSVMDVPTAPYKGAHYATFPPNLIAPLIRATCPRWACPVCGQGWSPVVEKGKLTKGESARYDEWNYGKLDGFAEGEQIQAGKASNMRYTGFIPGHFKPTNVKEYRPTCEHEHTKDEAVPGICLDPFVGSGTTVMVAKKLLRRGIGLDISMEYIDQQAKIRTGEGSPSKVLDDLPLFALMDEEV